MASAGRTVGLFKRTWDTIPEIVGSSFMGLIGIALAVGGVVNYYSKDGDNRRYRHEYTVLRHDDPLVKYVRKD